jgi:hypothetical protein
MLEDLVLGMMISVNPQLQEALKVYHFFVALSYIMYFAACIRLLCNWDGFKNRSEDMMYMLISFPPLGVVWVLLARNERE